MESYLVFAWAAAILLGVETILAKLTSKYAIKNPWVFNFVWNFIILLYTVAIALFYHIGWPHQWENIIIAGLFYALSGVFYTWSLYLLDVSVLSPLFNFRSVFSVLLGVWLLGQLLTTQQYVLIGITFVAGLFVSFDEHFKLRSFFRIPILIALIAMVVIAAYGIYINKAIAVNGYWTTTVWAYVIAQILLTFTWPKFGRDIRKISKKQISALAILSIAGTAGMLAANQAYTGKVGIASTIISLPVSMVLAFLFAVFAPTILEKHTMKTYAIRFIAAAIMLAAAIKLTV
jgi:drug/metabolite transporter (DMT)-like permease